MLTIYDIARHTVTEQPYATKAYNTNISFQESQTYQVLSSTTNLDTIQNVKSYIEGKLLFEELSARVNTQNAHEYLAAAKLIDLENANQDAMNTTYKVRELCILRSSGTTNSKPEINMLNAFSNPPLVLNDVPVDLLLANELDNSHPLVQKAAFGEERNRYLAKIYTYAQKQALIIPEIIPLIEQVISSRFEAMKKVAEHLPEKTFVVFKGCSGAGKTYALEAFVAANTPGLSAEKAVQSTDNTKEDIRSRTGKIFSDQQAHLLSFSVFKMLVEVVKEEQPFLSTLQEGWFNSSFAIEGLFKDLNKSSLKLDMRDFDGDFEALCLRVLSRHNCPSAPKPPFEQVIRGFKTSRESRIQLLNSLRSEDKYQFHFVNKNGEVDLTKDPKSISHLPSSTVDEEIEATKNVLITEQHSQLFGESLTNFIGLTIEDAFKKAKEVRV
ncbi:MAG: hypothetical protein K0S74_813 [Chlamydiales bacterium]|jgi:hypothetical protein|nr:hypothetical protein [Chlamydiales bacterium]